MRVDTATGARFRSTTVLTVRHQGQVVMVGDGQVTMGDTVVKSGARKVRRMHQGRVLAGFAGASADAMTLFDRLEGKLDQYKGNLTRAAVELGKDWRTDKMLRRLEALLVAVDGEHTFIISGTGDVIEPEMGVAAIGSGGPYALAAARALMEHSSLDAEGIARTALEITADICIYTNNRIVVEVL